MPASARTLLAIAAIAGAIAIVVALSVPPSARDTAATTPTPTASPTPTPTATATPYPQTTITIRFVQGGEQITIGLTQPVAGIAADGVTCNIDIPHVVVTADHYTTLWPLGTGGLAHPCLKGSPTLVRIEFLPFDLVNDVVLDIIAAEVHWVGEDITVDLEVPKAAQFPPPATPTGTPASSPTAHPASTPTATPGGLPSTGSGDPPRGARSVVTLGLIATLAGAAVAAVPAASVRRGK